MHCRRLLLGLGLIGGLFSSAHAAVIRLENAADGSSEMTLAPGQSGVMNVILEVSDVDTWTVDLVVAQLDDDDNCIDVTARACAPTLPASFCSPIFALPAEISEDGANQYILEWFAAGNGPLGPGTYVLDELTLTHTGPAVTADVDVTFENVPGLPYVSGPVFGQWAQAPAGFPADIPNFLYVGDTNSNNPSFTIHKVMPADDVKWNRTVRSVAVSEPTPEKWTITASMAVEGEGELTQEVDLTTTVEFFVNSVSVGIVDVDVNAQVNGCGIQCATTQPCICCTEGCFCGTHTYTAETPGGVELEPGDEITVLISAAPGTAQDDDDTDDKLSIGFEGQEIYWDRLIRSVDVVPNENDPSKPTVSVQLGLEGNYEGDLLLSTDVELLVNGVSRADYPGATSETLTWHFCPDGCDSICIEDHIGTVFGQCTDDPDSGCTCKDTGTGDGTTEHYFTVQFVESDLEPGDEIIVRLAPSPGSVAELAAYQDSDKVTLTYTPSCEGDANGDGQVDPLDSGYVQARLGCKVGTGDSDCDAADVNGDLIVDPLDVGFVLARFGACP